MDVQVHFTTEPGSRFDHHMPSGVAGCLGRPCNRPESRRALSHRDPLAFREPVLRRGFLEMANVTVIFLIAEQPP